jgi:hypothetical protein
MVAGGFGKKFGLDDKTYQFQLLRYWYGGWTFYFARNFLSAFFPSFPKVVSKSFYFIISTFTYTDICVYTLFTPPPHCFRVEPVLTSCSPTQKLFFPWLKETCFISGIQYIIITIIVTISPSYHAEYQNLFILNNETLYALNSISPFLPYPRFCNSPFSFLIVSFYVPYKSSVI